MAYEIDHFPGRQLYIEGKSYLYFGGTAYLGLQTDASFQELFIANIKKYGTNYGASRKSNVQFSIFEEAENRLSEVVGSEACLTMSSGYLTGQFVARHFDQEGYTRYYAPNTHSALFSQHDSCFENYTDLHTSLRLGLTENPSSIPVVFLDSIDFSGSNYPDFENLKQLPLGEIILVVDDSHGIGIVGNQGGGVYAELIPLKPKELVVCASLGKGFGVQAGAIFGSTHRIQLLAQTDFFGGASPAAPAAMATLLQADAIYRCKRILLNENSVLFQNEVEDIARFTSMKDHPTFSFANPLLANYLNDNSVIVTNFHYPSDDASAMSRIVISAAHTEDDILTLVKLINSFR